MTHISHFLTTITLLVGVSFLSSCGGGGGGAVDNLLNIQDGDKKDAVTNDSIKLDPATYDFGPVLISASAPVTKTVTVENISKVILFVSDISGATNPDFDVTTETCTTLTAGLSPGKTCQFVISFKPASTGAKSFTANLKFGQEKLTSPFTSSGSYLGLGATPANLSLSDDPLLDFGATVVGGSGDRTLTLTNSGTYPSSSNTALALSGDFAYKGGTYPGTGGTCGATLDGGGACSIVVRFTPSSTGTQTTTLSLTYDDGTSTIQTASRDLQGTGAPPAALAVSDGPAYDFGTLPVGGSGTKAFTISNAGGVAATGLTGSGLASPFTFAGGSFPGTGGTCGSSLAAAATCTVVVKFAPTVNGSFSDTVDINYNDGLALQATSRDVSGTAVLPATLAMTPSPTADFGTVIIGNTQEVSLTVTNSGQFGASSMSGAGLAAPFTFKGGTYPGTGGSCTTTLAPAGTCTLVVVFTPTAPGLLTDAIELTYNDGAVTRMAMRAVQGQAVTPATLAMSNGPTYNFGTHPTGSSTQVTLTVTNTGGTAATTVTGYGLVAPYSFVGGSYPGTGGTCGATINSSVSCTVTVSYDPTTSGTHTDDVEISYFNGVSSQTSLRALTAVGVPPASLAISNGPTYDFAVVPIGSSANKTLTVSNAGGYAASSLVGSGLAAPFSFLGGSFPGTGGTCTATLAAAATCTVVVTYTPAAVTTSNDTLDLQYNDGVNSQTTSRDLSGTGVQPGLLTISDGPTYDFGVVASGASTSKTFTLSNAGGYDITTITEVGLAAPFAFLGGTFPGTGGTCATGLTVGSTCTVVVSFSPTSVAAFSDTIDFTYHNGVTTIHSTRGVQGNGTPPALLTFSDGPTYSFGSIPTGGSTTKTLTVTNSGGVAATAMAGAGLSAPFAFVGGTYPGTGGDCSATLSSGASCTVVIGFDPTVTGLQSDTVELNYFTAVSTVTATRAVQGTGVLPANLTISDGATYDFGLVAVGGGTAEHTFTVANAGEFPANLVSGSGLAAPFVFKGGSYPGTGGSCSSTLAVGANCSLVVVYAPSATGVQSDTIELSYNDGVTSQTSSRGVTGTGAAPASLSLSDGPTYDFGDVATGGVGTKTFTLSNGGGVTATSISGGGLAQPFAFKGGAYPGTGGTCSTTLAAGANCSVVVTYSPTLAGGSADTIDISYQTGAGAAATSRDVIGNGVTPATLTLSDGPTFDYGIVANNGTAERTFTVTNSGDVAATSISGSGLAAPFAFKGGTFPGSGGSCGTSLAPAGTCTVVVSFLPTASGSYSDTIDVSYDNGATTTSATRSIQGVGAPPGTISISDGSTYDFGSWANGSTHEHTFTLTNTGGVPTTSMNGAGLALPFLFKGGTYPGTGGSCALTLAAAATCTIVVEYSPTSLGSASDVIEITYQDGVGSQTSTRSVSGTSVAPATLSISDGPTYDYGTVAVGGTADRTLTVTNTGGFAASSLLGSGLSSPFSFKGGSYPGTGGTCAASLGVAASCTIVVRYSPVATGTQADDIEILYNDGAANQTATRGVQGTGATPATLVISDGVTYDYGTLANGSSADKTFTVNNTGGVTATTISGSGLTSPFTYKGGSFPGTGGSCTTTLAAGANCQVVVTYGPSSLGAHTSTIQVGYFDGVSSQTATRGVQGTAVAPANLSFSNGPAYDFGTLATGGVAEVTLTVTNSGAFTATSMSGQGLASPFSFKGGTYPGSGGTCSTSLAASGTCTVVLNFQPLATGVQSDTVEIAYYDGAASQVGGRALQGTGVTPALVTASDGPTYNYGTVATGGTAEKTFTLTNSGGFTATTLSGTGLALPYLFKGGSYPGTGGNCGASLGPSSTCTVVVVYSPTATGAQSDTVEFNYYDGAGAQLATRPLQGIGATPALLAISDGPTYDYGSISFGAVAAKSFTLSNSGGVTATAINGSGLASPYSFKGGSFPGTGGTCGSTLSAGGNCLVVVTYSPTTSGLNSEDFDVSYFDGVTSQVANRAVQGTGVAPALLTLSDGPTYDFGAVPTTGSSDKVLTLTNSGDVTATAMTGSGLAAPFSFKGGSYPGTGGTCVGTLAPTASCTVVVTFNPTVVGPFSDTVDISYHNGTAATTSTRDIQGTGALPASLAISDGPTFDFGSVANGSVNDKTLTVTNNGGVSATALAGTGLAAPYTFKGGSYPGTGGTCGVTLTATASCTVVIQYNPSTLGIASDSVEINYTNGLSGQTATRAVTGESVTPALLVISDGLTYDYGTVAIGGTSDKTFTVSNSGAVAASSISGSGLATPFSFKGGSFPGTGGSCSTSLNAGSSCTIVVRYAPTATGAQADTIDLNYYNGASSQVSNRALQGAGADPANLTLNLGPTFNFGTLASGGSLDQSFVVTNSGGVNATSMSGAGLASPFRFKGGTYPGTGGSCSVSLAAGATCTVTVTYNPTAVGSHSDTIEIAYEDGVVAQTASRDVQGTAVTPASLAISDGATYDYGTRANGSSTDHTFTLTNSGSFAASALTEIGLAAPFVFKGGSYPGTGGSCGGSLNGSSTCTIVVAFAPTASGLASDSVEIQYNDGANSQTATRSVQGTGAPPASITISDGATYDYGTQATGSVTDKTFTISNSGGVPAASLAVTGLAAPFAYKGGSYPGTGGTCGATLGALSSCTIVVSYSPVSTGAHAGQFDVGYANGVTSLTESRPLAGTGAAPALLTLSDADPYDYGSIATGGSADRSFTVTNTGGVSATGISGAGIVAPYTFKGSTFPGTGGSCTATLASGATCTVIVTFAPTVTGAQSDTVDVTYHNGVTAGQTVSRQLTGTGVAPANLSLSDGPTYDFGAIPVTGSVDKTFTITNGGNLAATAVSGSGLAAPYSFKGGTFPGTGGTCGVTLNASASCTVVVTYHPIALGATTDSIDISYHNGASTQSAARDVQGTGATPASLAVSDGPTYNFGSLANGSSAEKALTVTNSGGVSATAMAGSGLASPFVFKGGSYPGTGGSCGATLTAASTCTIVVVYAPSVVGAHSDTIDLAYHDGLIAQATSRDIVGTSVPPASLAISDGATYDFGTVATGGSTSKTFTVTNSGSFVATSMAGAGLAAPFTFKGGTYPGTGGTCTTSLNATASCTIVVTYAPTSTGAQSDTIELTYFDGASGQNATRDIQGVGATPAQLTLSDGPTYDYGTYATGASADKSFILTNTGGFVATGISGGGLAAPFVFKGGTFPGTGGSCTGTLAAAGSCTIVVTFNPTVNGSHSDSIDVTYNDGVTSQSVSRAVQGTSVAPASITISDGATYDFGTHANGSSTDKTFTLTNAGGFTGSSLSEVGLAAPFGFKGGSYPGTGGTCGGSLNATATCTIVVSFAPSSSGLASDSIDLQYYDGAGNQNATRAVQGTGAPPAVLAFVPATTYDYGTQATTSTTDKSYTLTNSGGVAATALAATGLAAPFNYKGGSYPGTGGTCGATLNALASCTIVVTYSPVSTGLQSDTLDMAYNDGVTSQSTSQVMQGTGAAPALLTLSDSDPYNYGSIATGGSADRAFTVTNTGGVSATTLSGAGLDAPYGFKGALFPGTGGTCGATLVPTGTCTIIVTFAPTAAGVQADTVDVTYHNGVAAGQTVSRQLTGTGVTPANLAISDGPNYDFGAVPTTGSVDKTFTISNSGSLPATAVSGAGLAAPFTFKGGTYPGTGGTCGGTLNASTSCTVVVTFNPTALGAASDTLEMTYDNGASVQTATRNVQGTGATPASLAVSDGPTFDFGSIANGSSAEATLTISNSGGVSATAIAGSGLAAPFSFKGGSFPGTGGSCGGTLAAASSCTMVLVYSPTALGTQNATVTINYNNGLIAQSTTRDMQGTAVPPASLAISDGATYDFGTVATGATASKAFTVTNTGSYTATSLSGAGLAAPFTFKGGTYPGTGGTCTTSLNASASCTVVVNYAPTSTGAQADTIEISYFNGASTQTALRDVQGVGATPALLTLTDGPTYNYGTYATGASADKSFTLTNTGGFTASSVSGGGLAAPFTFKGGTFPGTGGNCTGTLASTASCTIVVTFNPTANGSHADTMDVTYNDGVTGQTVSRDIQGTSVAPASITISDGATYDYGTHANGSSTDHTFVLTNAGAFTATTLTEIGLSAPFAFKGGSYPGTGGTCGGSLNASATCTVVVSFSPSTSGLASNSLTVQYYDGASTQSSARAIQGTGAPPASLSISDGPTYDFGTQATTSNTDKTLTVTNSGGVAATSLSGAGLASPFTFKGGSYPGTGGTCSATLNALSTCTVVVTYSPVSTGLQSDTLDMTYNDGVTSQTASRALQGTGAAPALLTLSDSDPYDYGSIATGGSADRSFTVTNTGGVPATTLSGAGLDAPYGFKGALFPGTGGNCGATLLPTASCTIVVTFAPTATGVQADTVDITYNNGVAAGQAVSRQLTGTGVAPANLAISDGPTYDYGAVPTTGSVDKTFTVSNSGSLTATTMNGAGLAAPFAFKGGSYPGTGGTCGASLNATGTCTLVVTFNPTALGSASDAIELSYDNGASLQTSTRNVQGTGATPASLAVSDGPTYQYGSIANGSSAEATLTVTNSGGVSATSIAGSGLSAPYSFKGGSFPGTGGSCGGVLAAATSCTMVIVYSPTVLATHNATVTINYNNGLIAQSTTRDLQGTAVPPASLAISDGATYDFGTVATGAVASKTFTITNSGSYTATSLSGAGLAAPFTYKGGTYPGTGGTCSTTLNASASCTVVVNYAPSSTGAQSDTIEISYFNGASTQTATRDVQGVGASPALLTLTDGPTYNYGTYATGASADKSLTLTNTGGFTASGISGGGLAAPFTFKGGSFPGTGGTCTGTLSASGTCTIVVTFNPTANGVFSDTMDVTYNDGVTGQTVSRDLQGTAVAPASISISDAATYDYGTRANGSSTDHAFTLTNSGAFTASSLTELTLATPYAFKGGSYPGTGGNCGASMNAGVSCTVVVTFSPTASGLATNSLTIQYHDGAATQTSARPLQGTGAPPATLAISDGPTYDFGTKATTSSTDYTFTISNSGGVAATTVAGAGLAAPFTFKGGSFPGTGGTCTATLNALSSCTVVVNYSPVGTGLQTDTMDITFDNGVASQMVSRDVQGTGAAPALLTLTDSDPYNYGSVATGGSADRTFTVTNTGGVSATTLSGGGLDAPYSFKGASFPGTGGNCTGTLLPTATCTIVVTFAPTVIGAQSDTVDISYNNGVVAGQTVSRQLTGTGVAPANLAISDGPTYDFGAYPLTATSDKTFTITNTGSLTASSLNGTGLAAPFTFKGGTFPGTGGNCSTSLNAGNSCTIVVTFAPTGLGSSSDTIDITYHNGASSQTSSRDVQGTGATAANLAISNGPTYNYGSIANGSNSDATLIITNNGGVTATSLSGSGLAAPFSFKGGSYPGTGGTCSTILGAAATCTVVVTYSPSTIATHSDTLEINYSDGLTGQIATRDLQGTAVAPAALSLSDATTYDYGTIATGATAEHTFTLTNAGAFAATSVTGSGLASPFTFKGGSFPGTGGTCTGTLNASATCTIIVTYAPLGTGAHTDTIDVSYYSGASTLTASRDVQGVGASPAVLTLSDGPTYNFGTIATGSSADHTFTVSNIGGYQATAMSETGLSAPFAFKGGSFPGTGGNCTTTLSASSSCTIVVTYSPSTAGTHNRTMSMSYFDGSGSQATPRAIQGTAQDPANLVISDAATYDYGTIARGGVAEHSFTVTNTGDFSATVMNGSGLAAPFAFKGGTYPGSGGNCSVSLSSGSTCTIVVTFSPTSNGSASDAIDLSYNTGVSSTTSSRSVQGTGADPALLTISDGATYDFGDIANGATRDKSFTLTNSGSVTATSLAGLGLSAPYSFKDGTFPGTGGTCATTLAASASCTIVVSLSPVSVAVFNDTLRVNYYDGAGSQQATRALTANAVAPATLTITDGPTYDFGSVAMTASAQKTFTISNTGSYAASSITGAGLAAPYTFKGGTYPGTGGNCTATIAVGGSCNIVVVFAPTSTGILTDTIEINYNDGAATQQSTRALTGVGVAPANLVMTPSSYDFGAKANGSSTDQSVTVQNTGGIAATSVSGSGLALPFQFKGGSYPGTGGTCTGTITPSSSCSVVLSYSPTSSGTQFDTLDLGYDNGVSAQTASMNVQGTSSAPASLAFTVTSTYDFGTLPNTGSADVTMTITNSGGYAASSLTGSGLSAPFAFKGGTFPGTGGNCTGTLAASASCTMVVTFTPASSGSYSDSVDISYNDGVTSQSTSRAVQGVGTTPASLALSDSPNYDFGAIAVGATRDKTLTLTNSGGYTATLSGGSGLSAPFSFKGGSYPGTAGTCAGTLAGSGATCTIVVTYSPVAAGSSSNTVTISYNDGLAGQTATRLLQGSASNPASLAISDGPGTYDFGTKTNGSTTDKTFTVTNSGDFIASSVSGVGLTSPFVFKGGSYPGTGGTCTDTLGIGASCDIVVQFAPSSTGSHSSTLEVTYFNGASSVSATRALAGVSAGPAVLTINSGPTYDFGTVANTTTKDRSFTVTNSGGVTATGISGGGLAAPFFFKGGTFPGTGGNCTATLTAGSSCNVVVTFDPTVNGTFSDTLEINYTDGVTAQVSSRAMNAVAADPALLAVSDGSVYDYGTVPNGGTRDKALTITNSGGMAAVSLSIGGLATPFDFKGGSYPGTGGDCGTSLGASSSCTVVVTFAPSSAGAYSDTVDVTYNDGATTQSASRDIQGTGAAPAVLTISDGATYDFGVRANGSSTSKTFTITNSGGVSATVVDGSGLAAPFAFVGGSFPGTGGNCTATLTAGSSCNMVVSFTPSSTNVYSDTIDVAYNDGVAAQTAHRAVGGTGVTPANITISDAATYDFGTVLTVSTAEHAFTLTNSGSYAASSISEIGLGLPYRMKGGSFPGTGGTCTASLSYLGTCTIVVEFAPTITATFNDTIEISYNDGANSVSATRAVTGVGQVPIPPAAPTGLTVTINTPDQLNLSWTASASGSAPITYSVLRSTTSGSGYTVVTSGLTATSYNDTGVTSGTTYYYVIQAAGPGGNTANSSEVSAVPLGAFAISSVTPEDLGLSVAFSASPGASAYTVKYGTTSGVWTSTSSTSATSPHSITGLTAGTTYYVMVEARNANGSIQANAEDSGIPITVPTQISLGGASTARYFCAIMSNGEVRCWGQVRFGNQGFPGESFVGDDVQTMGDNLRPVELGTGVQPTKVATAHNSTFACAILDNTELKCWGRNLYGNLGQGNTTSWGTSSANSGDNLPAINLGSGLYATDIAVGEIHACAILNNGKVKCWGYNGNGMLGQGNTTQRGDGPSEMGAFLDYSDLGTGKTASQLALGGRFTCARLNDNSVKCWGNNSYGQLGKGNTTHLGDNANEMGDLLTAINLGTGRTASQIVAGYEHACALLDNGDVKCWGRNNLGQLGLDDTTSRGINPGEMGDSLAAVNLGSGRTAKKLAAGNFHTCAILDNDTAKCWGSNGNGQLGQELGTGTHRGDNAGEMAALAAINFGGNVSKVLDIVSGNYHGCAKLLLDTSDVLWKCWGSAWAGQLGTEAITQLGDSAGEMGSALPAINLGTGMTINAMSLGADFGCALRTNASSVKSAVCWGHNQYGRLGLGIQSHIGDESGEMGQNLTPVNLGVGRTAKKIAVGLYHACAILDNDRVKCWGRSNFGQTGYETTSTIGDDVGEMASLDYVDLGTNVTVKAITAGIEHTCAIIQDDSVRCWGRNLEGQLGQGNTTARGTSTNQMGVSMPTINLGTGRTAKEIQAGAYFTCAILDTDAVKCWGQNSNYRQLGNGLNANLGDGAGEMGDSLATVNIGSGRTAKHLAVGAYHVCVHMDNDQARCWGRNDAAGILGRGNATNPGAGETPDTIAQIALGTGRTIKHLYSGAYHACAILDTDAVKCWGRNSEGQLGLGDVAHRGDGAGEMGDSLTAVNVGTSRTVTAIGTHDRGTCALFSDKVVRCWGDNPYGELGNGDVNRIGDAPVEMGDALLNTDLY